jgi:hypothetical protein
MRAHLLSKLMVAGVGGGVAAYLYGKRRHDHLRSPIADRFDASDLEDHDREPTAIPGSMDVDPADPVQGIDEVLEVKRVDLAFDAMSAADGDEAQRFAEQESTLDEASMELDTPQDTTLDAIERAAHDVGDLYGVHTPPATDRVHPDDLAAFEEGQNWLEALGTSAAENGTIPEHELSDIVDDADIYDAPHASDDRDLPVADRGSGGPAGI